MMEEKETYKMQQERWEKETQEEWERESKNPTKITSRVTKAWHSGREIEGYYPTGTTIEDIKKKFNLNKYSMPKFEAFKGNYFRVSYFTD